MAEWPERMEAACPQDCPLAVESSDGSFGSCVPGCSVEFILGSLFPSCPSAQNRAESENIVVLLTPLCGESRTARGRSSQRRGQKTTGCVMSDWSKLASANTAEF